MNEFDQFIQKIEALADMNGAALSPSDILWKQDSKISPTRSEAFDQARADSIKKRKPFREPSREDINEATERSINKYIDDWLGGMI